MKELEKSIRHHMAVYGARIRTGHYGVAGYTVGCIPDDYKTVELVCCDYDREEGVVTDIRIYGYGDSKESCDYNGESINITEPVIEFLKDAIDWNSMISAIVKIVERGAK